MIDKKQFPGTEVDLEMATQFLNLLDPNAEEFTFQLFKDDKTQGGIMLHGSLAQHSEKLIELNQQGYGVHVAVNETDLQGRKLSNIKRIRCVFQEDDDGFDGNLPLVPHLVNETSPGKYHRYFLTTHSKLDDFKSVMETMVSDYGSDPNAKDVTRVLRLPGFYHQKPDKVTGKVTPFKVRVVKTNDHAPFQWEEIRNAFPEREKDQRTTRYSSSQREDAPDGKVFKYALVYAALHHVDPNCDYHEWRDVGMAIHHESGGSFHGFVLFESWSMGGLHNGRVNKYIPGEPKAKWDSFSYGQITIGTLFFHAKEGGWNGEYRYTPGNKNDTDAISIERNLFFDEFNRMHGMAIIQGQTVVVRSKAGALGGVEKELMTVSSVKTYYDNLKIPKITQAGVILEKLFHFWKESPMRRQYQYGARFMPKGGLVAGNQLFLPDPVDGCLELYSGLAIEPKKGEYALISQHIYHVWCRGDDESYSYTINWMARMLQQPQLPGETAIVLRSGEGTGKNIIADIFAEAFGPHGGTYTKGGDITGRFSDHLATCVFVFLNEAIWGGDKQAEGTLKALITDKTITYEKKYMPKFAVKNCLHIMMASNNDWVAPVGMDDRRYFFLDVGEDRKGDQAYFNNLFNQIENGGKEAFIWHLLNHDISGFNPRVLPQSKSETRLDNKLRTKGTVAQWWNDVLDDGFLANDEITLVTAQGWKEDEIHVPTHELHDNYLEWCKKHNERYPDKKTSFSKALNELLPWECLARKQGKRTFKFLPIKKCRTKWRKMLHK